VGLETAFGYNGPMRTLLILLGLSLVGCPSKPVAPTRSAPAIQPGSIGSATMLADRTIVMNLRASGPGPQIGDAQLRYPPSHAKYQEVLRHLGGLQPGETKSVPPFP
jgi:hypothetical protein